MDSFWSNLKDILEAAAVLVTAIGIAWVKISQRNMSTVIDDHGKKIDQQTIATASISDQNAVIVDQNKTIVHQTNGAMRAMADLSEKLGNAQGRTDQKAEDAKDPLRG